MKHGIRTIVVGVATVNELDPVLPAAIELARRTGASTRVVHAFVPPDPVVLAGSTAPVNLGTLYRCQVIETVAASLEAQCAQLADRRQDVEVDVRIGPVHHELPRYASEVGADLLVIGSTRRGNIMRHVLGTTAERVIRHSATPVLVAHRRFSGCIRRVLLTTDLSDHSAAIHESALDLIEDLLGAEVEEVRSLLVMEYYVPQPAPLSGESVEKMGRTELDRFLAGRRSRRWRVSGAVRVGDPPTEINLEADAWEADLVVFGTHGRRGVARYVFGSVAAAAVRAGRRNALVIPPTAPGRDLGPLTPVAAPY